MILSAAALLAAVHEISQPPERLTQTQWAASQVVEARYPELPQYVYYRGLDALQREDYSAAQRLFEEALAARLYTNEGLLYTYTSLLIHLDAPQEQIDRAAGLWRKHFPHSRNPDPRASRGEQGRDR